MSQTFTKGTQPKEETKSNQPSSPQKPQSNPGCEVFVKSLPFSTNQDQVAQFFADCGTVENINLLRDHLGRLKGNGFIRFATKEAATKAVAKNGKEFEGRTLVVELAKPKEERPSRPQGGFNREANVSKSVFIGNLSYATTENDLRNFFKDCGSVKAVRLATDADGSSKGFAHIDFDEESDAELAVKKSGSELDGRNLRVDFANASRGGGFRGGRGGFRGGRGSYTGNRGRGGYGGSRGGGRGGFGGPSRGEGRGGRGGFSRNF